ncbi:MAG: hypothetical protein U1E11_07915, partial [Dethiobacteria bacterium]|nr:hypothetical protein [Dethiobacteria bacterium]
MLIRKAMVLIMVFVFTLALGSSALAVPGSVLYRKSYELDGQIFMKMLAGSAALGGEHKTLVWGEGILERHDLIVMGGGEIEVRNLSDWIADPSSPAGLEVASTFKQKIDLPGGTPNTHNQIFAVSVKANRGESGSLRQIISAAAAVYDEGEEAYFTVDQTATTSGGIVKRYINVIVPASGEQLFEDSNIKGSAKISDQLISADGINIDATVAGADADQKQLEKAYHDADGTAEVYFVLDGGTLFEGTVLPGLPFEEVALPSVIELASELFVISDITIIWKEQSVPEYDSSLPGKYLFEGELIFPEHITPP